MNAANQPQAFSTWMINDDDDDDHEVDDVIMIMVVANSMTTIKSMVIFNIILFSSSSNQSSIYRHAGIICKQNIRYYIMDTSVSSSHSLCSFGKFHLIFIRYNEINKQFNREIEIVNIAL